MAGRALVHWVRRGARPGSPGGRGVRAGRGGGSCGRGAGKGPILDLTGAGPGAGPPRSRRRCRRSPSVPALRQPHRPGGSRVPGVERTSRGWLGVKSAPAGDGLDLLARGDLRPLSLLPRASNFTFLAEVVDGDRTALAVYKPRAGETPLWDFPEGTLCNREVAAYLVARELGWPDVPATVLRDGPHGEGSVQLYLEADPAEHYFSLRDRFEDVFRAVAAFDLLVGNGDRKAGHCLLAPDGRVWSVDHGLCFAADPWLRTVIWDFAGDPIPEALG